MLYTAISDTGPGIPEGIKDRIFDPFFSTKKDKGGTGLGLAIANQMIFGEGGKILLESTPGNGTTFKVLLPVRTAQ